jgi:hypothetical protein
MTVWYLEAPYLEALAGIALWPAAGAAPVSHTSAFFPRPPQNGVVT